MQNNLRQGNKEKALNHTKEMERRFSKEITASIDGTKLYTPDFGFNGEMKSCKPEISVVDMDSVSSVLKYHSGKTALLNFASYRNPGGGFITGAMAQEEALCHESFLYNVLSKFPEYYEWNESHKNKSLYLNRALYSPNIRFLRAMKTAVCDVITCAAPNRAAAQKNFRVSDQENRRVLQERIDFILGIAAENQVDTLILGAYGCGVFGQDAAETAELFKALLEEKYRCFSRTVFAVPDGRNGNFRAFQGVFQ